MDFTDLTNFTDWELGMGTPDPEKLVAEKVAMANMPMMPTPPTSEQSSPEEEERLMVSVSTTFFPGAHLSLLPGRCDLIILSSDAVFFYVHCHSLLEASDNNFDSFLSAELTKDSEDMLPIVSLPETASVLNVVLHTVYYMSCSHYSPSPDTLIAAVDTLVKYGIHIKAHIAPGTPLYSIILAQAPLAPMPMYALAAKHDLYELAVPISAHLLSFTLSALTDEQAAQMGSTYLRRLFFLHLGRIDALKRLLLEPPHLHPPTPTCDFVEQKKLTRAWALATAYLAWDARPDLSISAMERALLPLGEQLSCEQCQNSLNERIKPLIVQWAIVRLGSALAQQSSCMRAYDDLSCAILNSKLGV
ncbi:hypothetical protein B0H21DRAFT_707597 [Amylocystis lapponica]|nr:hypothetical protein B0H21DRAFT_707597 [Amylocystis lapponica]